MAAHRDDPSRAALKLLRALAEPGAYAFEADGAIAVAAPRAGVSVRVARAQDADAQALCDAGLAAWERGAGDARRRLRLADAGRARLARAAAAPGVDPWLNQHRPIQRMRARAGEAAPAIDAAESPIAWLATRKGRDGRPMIEPAELAAGERLRRDLTLAQMSPRVTASWSPVAQTRDASGGSAQHFSEAVLAARQRVADALDAVGSDFSGLLLDVCGFLKGLEQVEGERGWPARSGKVALRLGLRQLCRHYRIETEAIGPARSRGVRHWGAQDYRPAIDAGG